MKLKFIPTICLMILLALVFASCTSNKKLTEQAIYFKNLNDTALMNSAVNYEPKFQKGDILYIGVTTANEASARLFNQSNVGASTPPATGTGSSTGMGSPNTTGYLVDEYGNITMPLIGKVHVAGSTKAALEDLVTKKVKEYASDAIISIRLLNYKITILGEVAKPGAYSIPNERVTVLDAIGLAGDLTVFGKRNIRIIRESEGKRETGFIDLNKGDIFDSPYYYLRQNDILYIEMNDRKMANADQSNVRNLSLGLGIISAVSLIITTLTRF